MGVGSPISPLISRSLMRWRRLKTLRLQVQRQNTICRLRPTICPVPSCLHLLNPWVTCQRRCRRPTCCHNPRHLRLYLSRRACPLLLSFTTSSRKRRSAYRRTTWLHHLTLLRHSDHCLSKLQLQLSLQTGLLLHLHSYRHTTSVP